MADDKEKQDQESLKAVQAQNETAKELLSTYEKLKKVKGSLTQNEKDTLNIAKQLVGYSKTLETSIQQRLDKSSTSKQLSQTLNKLEKEYKENLKNSGNIVDKLNKQKTEALKAARQAVNEEKSIQKSINITLAEQDVLEDKINKLKGKKGQKAKEELASAREDLRSSKSALNILDKKLESTKKQRSEQISLAKQADEAKKTHSTILKQQEQEVELSKEALKTKRKEELIDKISNISLVKRFKDTLSLSSIFSFILDAAFKIDKQITQLSKSLGISKESAGKMRDDMYAFSQSSGDSFINVDRLMKAQEGLTEQLGIAVNYSNEERETFARLTEITGLTADEAGKLAQNSAAAGMSTKAYLADIRNAAFQAQLATNTHITDKKLLQDISKLSAGILVKFQGNPKAIAEAVVQANKLGLNLDKVDKIGDSLLDWESSINNELEAELITGKKLNLERAREAALTGDQATLMQEIASQAGSLEEFSHMNVIAQQSLAKAFGMNREEMSDMLMKQEAINKYGDKAADLNKEQLEYMEKNGLSADQMQEKLQNQRDTQEKFNDLIIKVQEAIAQMAAGPLGTVLNMFMSLLENAGALKVIIGAIAAIYGGSMVIGLGKTIAQLGIALGLSSARAIAEVTAAEAFTLGLATIAIVGGLAAVAAMMSSETSKAKSMHDGVMAPSGKILYSGKEGAIKLNEKDTVIAGTNLNGGGIKKQQPSSNSGMAAMGAMVDAINGLKAAANRPAIAYINGRDAFADNLGGNSSLGTSQMQNSYKLA